MTPTLQALPSEILRGIIAWLTGFDRLRLAHTSARFYRELLVDASHWSDAHDVTASQAKRAYVQASSLQFPAQTRAGFASGERGACVPVLRFFPGRKYGRPTSELFLPLSPRFFSIDLWFSLLPSAQETDVLPGGVLLGAQSVRLQDAFAYADYHQPFVWVDPSLTLSCSILDDNVEAHEAVVKPTLRTQQWYHLALTFDNGVQSVYLNGELLHTRHGDLHRDWRSLYYMQLGSGCVTGHCIGLDTAASATGWYGFHGVVDNFRVWAEALGVDDVRRLAQGHGLTASTPLSSLEECNRADWCGPVKRVRCSRPYEQVCILDTKGLCGLHIVTCAHLGVVYLKADVDYIVSCSYREELFALEKDAVTHYSWRRTMKLAKASAQRLKAVIVEYDVLCSTRIGQASASMQKAPVSASAQRQPAQDKPPSVSTMFLSDVRSMLKDLQQDSTGKPWIVKDRLQSLLQGLPAQMVDRMTGGAEPTASGGKEQSEDAMYLEKQLASATAEMQRMKELKAAAQQERRENEAEKGNSVRDKYLDKLNLLKAKANARQQQPQADASDFAGSSASSTQSVSAEEAKTRGLTTWLVNEGANELMSYSDLRGLFRIVIPPLSPLQDEEFRLFTKEMEGQFDVFMTKDDQKRFPDPAPILAICEQLELKPLDLMIVARHGATLKAARAAGANACHYMPEENAIPNHTADHHLTTLREFQHLIEDFNGISYRSRTHIESMF
ncbi:hypothetical protein Poli38472_004379 [Pythium oligandrum]|uniref:F-box domain-containing protein n=1 Tax=Pythium oligandrum TaxID=41045 RepID=A0A8K1FDD6_PYTOL|nr:hypothetical protein Poli38472_004379 [Pythium oligandrum]|eukprot:TMW59310.1 hypothetical protein Poli38472_004379 [Pythium oligandrum]